MVKYEGEETVFIDKAKVVKMASNQFYFDLDLQFDEHKIKRYAERRLREYMRQEILNIANVKARELVEDFLHKPQHDQDSIVFNAVVHYIQAYCHDDIKSIIHDIKSSVKDGEFNHATQ